MVGESGWLGRVAPNFYFYFFFKLHTSNEKTLHLFLLGHMREPLAKIIYEAREREGEREGGREGREGGRKGERSKRLSIIRDTGDAH